MPPRESLSIAEARRIALAAQQFLPTAGSLRGVRSFSDVVRRLGALQIDSVNVLVRSHYLPIFSRRGAYAPALLERAAYSSERTLFEYWGHEASFLPVEIYPLMRWRMERARSGEGTWGRLKRYANEHKHLVAAVMKQIREGGALAAGDVIDGGRSSGSWWGWSQGKEILEWLFWTGEVTTASRRNFERVYDLTERVLPAHICTARVPSKEEAQRALMEIAARALGIATLRDLRDYFRLPTADAASRLHELVEEGVLLPMGVEGWKQQAYLHAQAKQPRSADASALLSPFDSLIWERQRTERLFDFHFRLEIYTPVHKRQHGYYVLPFLLGDRLVGRVDLKSDRKRGKLQVRGGSVERDVRVSGIVESLGGRLEELSSWLGLEGYEVTSRRGELLKALQSRRRMQRAPKRARPALLGG